MATTKSHPPGLGGGLHLPDAPQRLPRHREKSIAGVREAGAAVVDFVLVGGLVTVIFVALIQLALVLHVRNTVGDAAASAARYGALGDRTAADAQERAAMLISTALGPNYVQDVAANVETRNGLAVLTVSIKAPLPVLGLLGPARTLEMTGHAVITK